MSSRFREDLGYRRGMVLGLTLAEIVILIIFILLLIISVFLTQRDERLAKLDRDLADKSRQTILLQEQIKLLKEFAPGEENFDELFNKLVIKRQETEELKKRVAVLIERHRTLVEKANALESELRAAKTQRDQVAEALARQGLDMSDIADMAQAQSMIEDLQSRLDGAKKEIHELRRQLEELGEEKGQHPPCWYRLVTRPNGKPRERPLYIFYVRISDDNIFVKDIPALTPAYVLQKPKLPFNRSALNTRLSFGEFVKSFKPLKDAADNKEVQAYSCKFYVKVWDATTSKKSYRRALEKVVETVFFTRIEDEPWPY